MSQISSELYFLYTKYTKDVTNDDIFFLTLKKTSILIKFLTRRLMEED